MDIFIYSSKPLPQGRGALEDDIDVLLGDAGEVTGGGIGQAGWNVDVEIYDTSDAEEELEKLREFLRQWPVPSDTYLVVDGKREALS